MCKFILFCPKNWELIEKIINAAAKEGAGIIGNYSHCAFVSEGVGVWKAQKGAKPNIGRIGKLSKEKEVKIEMECPKTKLEKVFKAIRKVHPYDKIAIDVVEITRFE